MQQARAHCDEEKGETHVTTPIPRGNTLLPLYFEFARSSRTMLDGLDETQLNWNPPAPHANSLYTLVVHTLGNAEENLLWTLFGQPCQRNREQEFVMEGPSSNALMIRWNGLREQLQQALLSLSSLD